MVETLIFTGTVTAAGWREGPILDFYGITLATDDGDVELHGTDRLNVFPESGQRIRVAARKTQKDFYKIAMLRDEVDPRNQMRVQIEIL